MLRDDVLKMLLVLRDLGGDAIQSRPAHELQHHPVQPAEAA